MWLLSSPRRLSNLRVQGQKENELNGESQTNFLQSHVI